MFPRAASQSASFRHRPQPQPTGSVCQRPPRTNANCRIPRRQSEHSNRPATCTASTCPPLQYVTLTASPVASDGRPPTTPAYPRRPRTASQSASGRHRAAANYRRSNPTRLPPNHIPIASVRPAQMQTARIPRRPTATVLPHTQHRHRRFPTGPWPLAPGPCRIPTGHRLLATGYRRYNRASGPCAFQLRPLQDRLRHIQQRAPRDPAICSASIAAVGAASITRAPTASVASAASSWPPAIRSRRHPIASARRQRIQHTRDHQRQHDQNQIPPPLLTHINPP